MMCCGFHRAGQVKSRRDLLVWEVIMCSLVDALSPCDLRK